MKTNICVGIYFYFSSVKIYSGGTGLHVKGMFNLIQNFQTPFQGVLFYTHPDNQVDFSCQSTSFHGYIITFSIGSSWRDGAMYGFHNITVYSWKEIWLPLLNADLPTVAAYPQLLMQYLISFLLHNNDHKISSLWQHTFIISPFLLRMSLNMG